MNTKDMFDHEIVFCRILFCSDLWFFPPLSLSTLCSCAFSFSPHCLSCCGRKRLVCAAPTPPPPPPPPPHTDMQLCMHAPGWAWENDGEDEVSGEEALVARDSLGAAAEAVDPLRPPRETSDRMETPLPVRGRASVAARDSCTAAVLLRAMGPLEVHFCTRAGSASSHCCRISSFYAKQHRQQRT